MQDSAKRAFLMAGTLFIVSAPSCAGKTSLLKALLKGEAGVALKQYTTYTTKSPRQGDIHGKDFHFITPSEFRQKIAKGYFIEWSNAYVHYYGTPSSIISELNAGKSYIIILDRAGAQQVVKKIPGAVLIWIYVSNSMQLRSRIQNRGQDSLEQIELRLRLAVQEMDQEIKHPMYQFHIKNDDFNTALGQLEHIVSLYLHNRWVG